MTVVAADVSGWARSGDANIAYRVLGEPSAVDLVFLSGIISHVEVLLEEPRLQRFMRRLTRSGRVILIDRRGSGLSDPIPEGHRVEDEVADIEAVLDAVGVDRAVMFAYAAGGPLAVRFAADRPERTLALVLYACMVRTLRDEDVPWASTEEEREQRLADLVANWGTGHNLDVMAPSVAGDPAFRTWLARMERQSMTPLGLQRMSRALASASVAEVLPSLRVPALVLHRTADRLIDVRHSRYFATKVPGAQLIELPGEDSLPQVGDMDAVLRPVERFLTGGTRGAEPERELLTVLFTDVVDSTQHAARLGDKPWGDLLAAHDEVVRRQLDRFGGREVKTIGDGFLATFTSPSAALRCAKAVVDGVAALGLDLRAGLHTGECELMGDDVGGMAVHIAARVAAMAEAGQVWASGTVYGTVVGSGMGFEDLGGHRLKGVPGWWPVFRLSAT